jgi:radical SAM enzyme (TIGR01210 family)
MREADSGQTDQRRAKPVCIHDPPLSDQEILAARPSKQPVDPERPYGYLIERECSARRTVEDVATVFLTNRECPWHCLMCDLWQYTTDRRVPPGAIGRQIQYALERLPPASHIKLFNAGSFFDRQAIPPEEDAAIARQLGHFRSVIVESHPRLCGDRMLGFQRQLDGELEVAMGLETVQLQVLARLNKGMSLRDFARAVAFLHEHEIRSRAFILLRPPFLDEQQGVEWAVRSLRFAFDLGVDCCSVIPTRAGNGIMDSLARDERFAPPCVSSLEEVLERGIRLHEGRVFVDLWDFDRFASCTHCASQRRDRLERMNWTQRVLPRVECPVCRPSQ